MKGPLPRASMGPTSPGSWASLSSSRCITSSPGPASAANCPRPWLRGRRVRDDVVVGIAQWLPRPGQASENLAAAVRLSGDLAQRGADLVVLPELWPCGFDWGSLRRDAASAAETLDGPRCAALAACARDLGVWLAAGSVPESHDGALYNTALFFDRRGRLRAWHRKAHLYSPLGETDIFALW